MVRNQNENYPFLKKEGKRNFSLFFFPKVGLWCALESISTFTRISIVKQTTLTIRLLHCLTSAVRLGGALKLNCKNCSCRNCLCAGHDGQIICQPVAPDVLRYVYTQTYTYTHRQKSYKKGKCKRVRKTTLKYR